MKLHVHHLYSFLAFLLSSAAFVGDYPGVGWKGDYCTTHHHQSYLQGHQCYNEATAGQYLYQTTKVR